MATDTPHRPVCTALVTGASSGIGRATARMSADQGFQVFGTSRRQLEPEAGVRMLVLDVRSAESVARCVSEVLDCSGRIDVLVNNAGMMLEGFAEKPPSPKSRRFSPPTSTAPSGSPTWCCPACDNGEPAASSTSPCHRVGQ